MRRGVSNWYAKWGVDSSMVWAESQRILSKKAVELCDKLKKIIEILMKICYFFDISTQTGPKWPRNRFFEQKGAEYILKGYLLGPIWGSRKRSKWLKKRSRNRLIFECCSEGVQNGILATIGLPGPRKSTKNRSFGPPIRLNCDPEIACCFK